MALPKKMEFEGKDVAEAISRACKTLNVSQENLDIEVLTTGTSGIFGLCRQKARLRVSLKKEEEGRTAAPAPKRQGRAKQQQEQGAEKKVAAPAPPAESVPETAAEGSRELIAGDELLADVKTHLEQILALMHHPCQVSVSSDRENVTARIDGESAAGIVGQNGRILDSLQYLLRKIIGKKYSEKAIITVDAGNYRSARADELKKLCLELADEVRKTGKTTSIPSLNPSERRIIHHALQDQKDIRSRSVGEGLVKKVLIYRPGSKGRKNSPRRKKGGRNK
jgi:spoIIIJ-associated protein